MAKSNTKANASESAGILDTNSVLLAILTLMVDERERVAKLDPSMIKRRFYLTQSAYHILRLQKF